MSSSPTRTGTKRKAAPSTLIEPNENSGSEFDKSDSTSPPPKSKRVKKGTAVSKTAKAIKEPKVKAPLPPPANGMPTNKNIPENISFPHRAEGTTRIVAWNVCGLAVSLRKGFERYIEAEDPDVLVLTETRVNEGVDLNPFLTSRYPHSSWSRSSTKNYSGTAILSKVAPIRVTQDLPGYDNPTVVNGRIVTMEFPNTFVVGCYVPNAGEKLKNMSIKEAWNAAFEPYIRSLDAQKPVVWLGDLNVIPTAKDLKNDKTNWNKSAGWTEIEVNAFHKTIAPSPEIEGSQRLVDIWRERHPDDQHYTYFSYRFNCREKQIGWRLDFFIISERLVPRVNMCEIRHEIYGGSDHLPITLDLEGEL